MSYGIKLLNSNGISLINDGERVPMFHAKYSVSAGRGTLNTGIPSSELFCIPFTRGQILCGVAVSGGYYVVNYRALSSGTIYVYRQANSTSGTYGIQVFNSDGTLAYQNNNRSLSILAIKPGLGASYSGKTLAVLPRIVNYNKVSAGGGLYYTYIRAACIVPGSPDTYNIYVSQTIPAEVEVYIYGGSILVIDVTGL